MFFNIISLRSSSCNIADEFKGDKIQDPIVTLYLNPLCPMSKDHLCKHNLSGKCTVMVTKVAGKNIYKPSYKTKRS